MDVLYAAFGIVQNTCVPSSILIAAVWITRTIGIHRLPKRTFSILWTICVFRALSPVVPKSPVNIQILLQRKQLPDFVGNTSFLNEVTDKGFAEAAESAAATTGGTPVAGTLAILWLLGVLVFGTYFLMTYVRCRSAFSQSLPLKKELDWNSGLLRTVQVRSSDRISAPLSYGLFRPVILFPGTMDWTDEEAISMILAHELVHIRRFDGILKGLLALSLCIYWWNPLVWCMFFLGNRDMELACDEAVILGNDRDLRRDYALVLIRMEERRGTGELLYSHFSETAIEERITAIMKLKKTTSITLIFALCLVIGLTMVFATDTPDAVEEGMIWPAKSCEKITMTFGERIHPITGQTMMFDHITISDSEGKAAGTEVLAAASGTVLEAEYDAQAGKYLVIDHGNGFLTKYTHCQELFVDANQKVQQGEVIASVGATGTATGDCLGFYVYQDGEAVDPLLYLE